MRNDLHHIKTFLNSICIYLLKTTTNDNTFITKNKNKFSQGKSPVPIPYEANPPG